MKIQEMDLVINTDYEYLDRQVGRQLFVASPESHRVKHLFPSKTNIYDSESLSICSHISTPTMKVENEKNKAELSKQKKALSEPMQLDSPKHIMGYSLMSKPSNNFRKGFLDQMNTDCSRRRFEGQLEIFDFPEHDDLLIPAIPWITSNPIKHVMRRST